MFLTWQDFSLGLSPWRFEQDLSTPFSSSLFLQDLSTPFSPSLFLQDLSTPFSPSLFLQDLSTPFSPSLFLQDLSTPFSPSPFLSRQCGLDQQLVSCPQLEPTTWVQTCNTSSLLQHLGSPALQTGSIFRLALCSADFSMEQYPPAFSRQTGWRKKGDSKDGLHPKHVVAESRDLLQPSAQGATLKPFHLWWARSQTLSAPKTLLCTRGQVGSVKWWHHTAGRCQELDKNQNSARWENLAPRSLVLWIPVLRHCCCITGARMRWKCSVSVAVSYVKVCSETV